MKTIDSKLVLLVLVVLFGSQSSLLAQFTGNKPEMLFTRYNGAPPGVIPVKNADIVGSIHWRGLVSGSTYLTGASIKGICTATPTATTLPIRLGFFTGKTDQLERLTILENGNVGINTTNPTTLFHVNGDGFFAGNLSIGGSFNVAGSITAGLDIIAGRDVKAGRHVEATENVSGKNMFSMLNITAGETISGKNLTASQKVTAQNVEASQNMTAGETISGKNLTASQKVTAQNVEASQNITAVETISGKNLTASQTISAGTNITAGGNISGQNGSFAGSLSAANFSSTGNITTTGGSVLVPSGRVVIGSVNTPAGYSLYVANGILTEKVKVAVKSSADWADYVFAENYRLRSLDEVYAFLKENKHLPDVPSASEIASTGYDMAKMDAKLLEKIEELTLYLIDLKKENQALRAEISSAAKH